MPRDVAMEIGSPGKAAAVGVVVLLAAGLAVWRMWPRSQEAPGTSSALPNTYYCEQCKQPFTVDAPPKPGEKPVCPTCKAATGRQAYEYLCGRCGKVYQSPLPLDQYPVCPHCRQCDPREVPPDAKREGK